MDAEQNSNFTSSDYRAIVAAESARFAEILRAGPLDARVPGCPDWNLGELGIHMAQVQRWSSNVMVTGTPDRPDWTAPEPSEAANALAEATPVLLDVLDAADPADPCWNWSSAEQTKAFWFRRQAIEVACHRWDAESAISPAPPALEPTLAADVIDELLHVLINRAAARDEIDLAAIPGDLHVHVTDTPGEWTVDVVDGALHVTDEHRKSAVAIKGEASSVALFLYNRVDADSVEVFGEPETWQAWSQLF